MGQKPSLQTTSHFDIHKELTTQLPPCLVSHIHDCASHSVLVSILVQTFVGDDEGEGVGALDSVGLLEGSFEGCSVGNFEGEPVGNLLGEPVGSAEGLPVGGLEGKFVGALDGTEVG